MKKTIITALLILLGGLFLAGCGSTTTGVTKDNCEIKGNISSSGEKIYHVPGQKYYGATQIDKSAGERWFCSESEATRAGWRKSKL